MQPNFSWKESEETHYRDNECDPHEEVKPSEYVIEDLLPILSLWWRYNILAESFDCSSDSRRFKTQFGGSGKSLIY
jgi:hypothetical protein